MKCAIAIVACLLACVLAETGAHAEEPAEAPLVRSLVLEGSVALRFGETDVRELQAFVGFTMQPWRPAWRGTAPFVAVGGRLAWGGVISAHQLSDGDMPEYASALRSVLGPELRVGMAWPDAPIEAYAYLGGAAVWVDARTTTADSEPWIADRGQHLAPRLLLGAASPGHYHLLVELSWERVDGIDRAGIAVGGAL